jgi:hypothetical protein
VIIISSSLSGPGRGRGRLETHIVRFGAGLAAMLGLALVAGPAAALAQSPTNDQYDPTLTQIAAGGGGGGAGDSASEQLGGLPFTGLDLIAMVAVAACITALGIVLYRRSRPARGGATS